MSIQTSPQCVYGAEAILKRLDVMARQVDPVREDKDIEAVHDMRVASRRLRTAMQMFEQCLPGSKARSWRKAIRRVTKALGEARDIDVHIEFVEQVAKGIGDRRLRAGIDRLLLRLRQQRRALQPDVVRALDRLRDDGTLEQMQPPLRQVLVRAKLNRVEADPPCVRQWAAGALASRLEELLAFEPYVHMPEQIEPLHRMRIAAKHLRYAMEIFGPLYDDRLKEPIKAAKQVQQQLGDVHDCDVWVEFLPAFLQQERQRTEAYFGHTRPAGRLVPGIDFLRNERQQHRQQAYNDFVANWDDLQARGFWMQLYGRFAAPESAAGEPADESGARPASNDSPDEQERPA